MDTAYVLMHSPLVGPSTWGPVARRLPGAVVPSFRHLADAAPPFWPLVAATVAEAVGRLPRETAVVLVAHSNAGRFVPVVVEAVDRTVAACVFVDASLPARRGMTPGVSPALLETARRKADGDRLPPWSQWWDQAEIARMFPDPQTMRAICAEQPRLPLSFFEQSIPVPDGWDERPCAFLTFREDRAGRDDTAEDGTESDDPKVRDAWERGWPVASLPGRHLHQLVDPDAVAEAIRKLSHSR